MNKKKNIKKMKDQENSEHEKNIERLSIRKTLKQKNKIESKIWEKSELKKDYESKKYPS